MTEKQPTTLRPFASFVVERVPGKGYQVTSAEGECAQEWKEQALALLDTLGQPDPRQPAEHFRWVGPITPGGEYVGVHVKLMPNGEARYHQAWFQRPKLRVSLTRSLSWIFVLAVIFGAGVLAGRTLFAPDGPMAPGPVSGNGGLPGSSKVGPPAIDGPPDVRLTKLKNELASSRNVRAKLKEYLSQEVFTADISRPVVDEKRSVKLIADLDETSPARESIRLTNIEVATLVRLLETLEEWTPHPKAEKSERR